MNEIEFILKNIVPYYTESGHCDIDITFGTMSFFNHQGDDIIYDRFYCKACDDFFYVDDLTFSDIIDHLRLYHPNITIRDH